MHLSSEDDVGLNEDLLPLKVIWPSVEISDAMKDSQN